MARARSALRRLTCRRLFERSERSERSEFGDRPRTRAAQRSRRDAATAPATRSGPPARAFAAPVAGGVLARRQQEPYSSEILIPPTTSDL